MEEDKLTRQQKAAIMWADIKIFMYNKDKGEVMGRTADSWGKIGLFFFVYYACLAAFFAAMFAIAFSTMPEIEEGPKFTSIIAHKPLLLVYPGGVGSYKNSSPLHPSTNKSYTNFLHGYRDTQCYLKEKCEPGGSYRPEDAEKQCGFNLTSLGECAPGSNFGYPENAPCLYLRLSRIFDWKPIPNDPTKKFVGLDCKAEGDSKTEFIYHPKKDEAFPISFWPYRGESGFRTPIAAIQVKGNTKEIKVKCHARADNIKLSDTYKLRRGAHGQVEFTVAAPKV